MMDVLDIENAFLDGSDLRELDWMADVLKLQLKCCVSSIPWLEGT
jgi:hypothetical protein